MKLQFLFFITCVLFACQQSPSSSNSTPQSDPCTIYNNTLNGVFASKYMEGTMTWNGGINGTVEITGVDYNDMTCMYTVPDCTVSQIRMNCNGAGYDTELIVYSVDSFKLGPTAYARVQ